VNSAIGRIGGMIMPFVLFHLYDINKEYPFIFFIVLLVIECIVNLFDV